MSDDDLKEQLTSKWAELTETERMWLQIDPGMQYKYEQFK